MSPFQDNFVLCEGVSIFDLYKLHPAALEMFSFIISFCYQRGVMPHFSSIYRPPKDGISKSETHQEYRALDLLIGDPAHGWTTGIIDEFHIEFIRRFKEIGALKKIEDSYVSRPLVYKSEDGRHENHGHCQIRRGLKTWGIYEKI